jgi:hypothetical protein
MGTRFGAELPGPHPPQEYVDDLRGSISLQESGRAGLLPVHRSSHECRPEGVLIRVCLARQHVRARWWSTSSARHRARGLSDHRWAAALFSETSAASVRSVGRANCSEPSSKSWGVSDRARGRERARLGQKSDEVPRTIRIPGPHDLAVKVLSHSAPHLEDLGG